MVEAFDLLKTAFGGLKTDVGKKLVGLFFAVQLINFAGTYAAGMGTGAQAAGVFASIFAALATIVATIGALRGFREGELEKEMFTENLLWPFGRFLGANLVSTVFAYLLALVALLPAIGAAGLSGITSASGLSAASALVIGLGGLGVILAVGVFIYVAVTLILAQPLIAVDDRRMFQALDESVRRTKDERASMALALLGLMLAYFLITFVAGFAGGTIGGETVVGALTSLVVAPLMTPVSLCLLNYLTEELPEAE
jgi:hypothetical protein